MENFKPTSTNNLSEFQDLIKDFADELALLGPDTDPNNIIKMKNICMLLHRQLLAEKHTEMIGKRNSARQR